MPAVIFKGNSVKALKDQLQLGDGASVISSTTDPTSSAVDAEIGTILLNTSSGIVYRKLDSGSSTNWEIIGAGSGRINHIEGADSTFNSGTGDWATFDDGAVSKPVDGTGGTASVISISQNTSTALRGDGSLRIAHSAADGQGEGASVDFSVDTADKGLVQEISFDYLTDTNYTDDDLEVWVYDVTNATLIQPVPYKIKATGGNPDRFKAFFQTAIDSTSYRVLFFCPNTSTTSYNVDVENVLVGPPQYNFGTPVGPRTEFTLEINGSSSDPTKANTTTQDGGHWYRDGKHMVIDYLYEHTDNTGAAAGSGDYLFKIPDGKTIDTTELQQSGDRTVLGHGYVNSTNDGNDILTAVYKDTTHFGLINGSGALVSDSTHDLAESTVRYSFQVRVPIEGWSSSVQMSDDADTRVVAAEMYVASGSHTSSASWQQIPLDTAVKDTHAGFDSGSNQYVVPVSDWYTIAASVGFDSDTGGQVGVRVKDDGTIIIQNTSDDSDAFTSARPNAVKCTYLEAGSVITVEGLQNSGGNETYSGSNITYLSILRSGGASAIAASEKVHAEYYDTAGNTWDSTDSNVDYATKVKDTHNAVSGGTFTAPKSGILHYSFTVGGTLNVAASEFAELDVILNDGSDTEINDDTIEFDTTNTAKSTVLHVSGTTYVNEGDTIRAQSRQNGASSTFFTNRKHMNMSIFMP